MKILNLVFVGLVAIFFTACSTKPKCDDDEVVKLVKDIVYESGAVGDKLSAAIMQGQIPNITMDQYTRDLINVGEVAQKSNITLNSYEDFKKFDVSKLNENGLKSFNLLKDTIKNFYKTKPYTTMTTDDSDPKITYCKAKLFKDANTLEYSAQYTNDGKLYVEVAR